MELTKFNTGSEILAHIKHDMRQIPEGKSYGNESVDTELSKENYSLIDRGNTAAEVNKYRKDFEKQCFKYNRKNLVHAVELVIQCPSDCPQEQHEAFFQTTFDWYCEKYLPAGKDCVFVAEVHKDEHKYVTTLENGHVIKKDISKEHLHIMYVPVVSAGEKHPDFKYRLNADQLTRRAVLKDMHPSLQHELEKKGIQGTVYAKKSGDGQTIGLSVKQLKYITENYGVVLDHSITVDELAQIISKNVNLTAKVDSLSETIAIKNKDLTELKSNILSREHQIELLQTKMHNESAEITVEKEKEELRTKLQQKELENEKLRTSTQQAIQEKEFENRRLQEQLQSAQEQLKSKDLELKQSKERIAELEQTKENTWGADTGWGNQSDWGNQSGWNNTKNFDVDEEKTW